MSDPDRVSLHSSRSSIVANQAALSMSGPANTKMGNNIDPAAILLQQQLAGGVPSGGGPTTYTGLSCKHRVSPNQNFGIFRIFC